MDAIQSNRSRFSAGLRDGLPIGLGYISVSFSLGIYAGKAGLSPLAGFISSFLNHASAGEYSGYMMMIQNATVIELILVTLVANARYLLMGCALSQRVPSSLSLCHRTLVGFFTTDEIFAASISCKEDFNPFYTYGLAATAITMWSAGTSLGIIFGNILPVRIVSALSVALYGMFIAVIVPAAKEDRHVALFIAVSFAASWLFGAVSPLNRISSGMRVILLTIGISALSAVLFPLKEEAYG